MQKPRENTPDINGVKSDKTGKNMKETSSWEKNKKSESNSGKSGKEASNDYRKNDKKEASSENKQHTKNCKC